MLNLKDDNGTIIKVNFGKGFLNIKQSFVFQVKDRITGEITNEVVGKVCFEFGSYTSAESKKLKETIHYFMGLEDLSYLAEILKTGRIFKMCQDAKAENAYGSGFEALAGTSSSKQLKIQAGSDTDKFFIKALEGPGEKTETGMMAPKYNEASADKKIIVPVTKRQLITIGLSLERAIRYFDIWNAMGSVVENVEKMKYKGPQEAHGMQHAAPFKPEEIPFEERY